MLLRDYLDQHNIKILDFAEAIGVKRDCVQKYLSGSRLPRKKKILEKIIKVTNGLVTPNDFFQASTKKPKRSN